MATINGRKIKWTAVAILAVYGAAVVISGAIGCAPCTAVLTMQKDSLPSIYEKPAQPDITWDTPRVEAQ